MRNNRMRLVIAASTAILMALAGCGAGNGNKAGNNASGGSELRVAWAGDDSFTKAVNAALDAYEKKDGIKTLREPADWSGYWDKLATQTANRNAPDVIYQVASQIPNYSSKNALLDLNTVGIDLSNMDEGLKSFGAADGKLYGVVSAANTYTLITNKKILEQAGVTIPDGDYTWDDLAGYAKQIHDKTGLYGVNDGGGDLTLFVLWVRSRGHELYTDEGKLAATKDDFTSWFKYWDDLRKAGAVPPADVSAEGANNTSNEAFVAGKSAMTFGWTQDYISRQSIVKDELDPKLTPNDSKQPYLWMNAASMWAIPTTSTNQEAAAKTINFLINDDAAIEAQGLALGLPPTQKGRNMVKAKANDSEKKILDYMDTVAKVSKPLNRLWPAGFPQLRTKMAEQNEAIAFGSMSIDDGAQGMLDEAAQY